MKVQIGYKPTLVICVHNMEQDNYAGLVENLSFIATLESALALLSYIREDVKQVLKNDGIVMDRRVWYFKA